MGNFVANAKGNLGKVLFEMDDKGKLSVTNDAKVRIKSLSNAGTVHLADNGLLTLGPEDHDNYYGPSDFTENSVLAASDSAELHVEESVALRVRGGEIKFGGSALLDAKGLIKNREGGKMTFRDNAMLKTTSEFQNMRPDSELTLGGKAKFFQTENSDGPKSGFQNYGKVNLADSAVLESEHPWGFGKGSAVNVNDRAVFNVETVDGEKMQALPKIEENEAGPPGKVIHINGDEAVFKRAANFPKQFYVAPAPPAPPISPPSPPASPPPASPPRCSPTEGDFVCWMNENLKFGEWKLLGFITSSVLFILSAICPA